MKTAVIWGAGRIGRGFVAEILREGGYFIEFVDKDAALIEALNANRRYTIFKARERGVTQTLVDGGFRARHTSDDMRDIFLADELLIDVAVFKNDIDSVAEMIAPWLDMRANALPDSRTDIITNVNMTEPEIAFRSALGAKLGGAAKAYLANNTGVSGIFMMCISPDSTEEMRAQDPLAIYNNGFFEQAVDARAFKGAPPIAPRLRLSDRLAAEEARKLYTLNMAHCGCAYLGIPRGARTSYEAIKLPDVRETINRALDEAAIGLEAEYGFSGSEMAEWKTIIFTLLDNPYMADGLSRLGADSARKLGRDDRLAMPARLCAMAGGEPAALCEIIKSGYDFENSDPGTRRVRELVRQKGLAAAMSEISGCDITKIILGEESQC